MRILILRTEVIEKRTSFFIFTFTYKDQLIDVSHITMFNPSNHKNTRNFHDSEKFRPNTQNVVAPFDFATYTKGRLSIGSIKYFSRKKKKNYLVMVYLWCQMQHLVFLFAKDNHMWDCLFGETEAESLCFLLVFGMEIIESCLHTNLP